LAQKTQHFIGRVRGILQPFHCTITLAFESFQTSNPSLTDSGTFYWVCKKGQAFSTKLVYILLRETTDHLHKLNYSPKKAPTSGSNASSGKISRIAYQHNNGLPDTFKLMEISASVAIWNNRKLWPSYSCPAF